MTEKLDSILLNANVLEEFYKNYDDTKFRSWLLKILPEVEKCRNQKQDNPWHIYNCLDHILHSVEAMNNFDKDYDYKTRRMLAYTMFLHDIGKPNCYIRRYSKLYGREVDSFFNHNKESAKIARRVLPFLNFDKKEQEILNLLVENHDIFMFIRLNNDGNKYHKLLTIDLIDDYVKKFSTIGDGIEIMKYLIMVGYSDSSAQNPAMTKPSFELLKKMEDVLEEYQNEKKEQE